MWKVFNSRTCVGYHLVYFFKNVLDNISTFLILNRLWHLIQTFVIDFIFNKEHMKTIIDQGCNFAFTNPALWLNFDIWRTLDPLTVFKQKQTNTRSIDDNFIKDIDFNNTHR